MKKINRTSKLFFKKKQKKAVVCFFLTVYIGVIYNHFAQFKLLDIFNQNLDRKLFFLDSDLRYIQLCFLDRGKHNYPTSKRSSNFFLFFLWFLVSHYKRHKTRWTHACIITANNTSLTLIAAVIFHTKHNGIQYPKLFHFFITKPHRYACLFQQIKILAKHNIFIRDRSQTLRKDPNMELYSFIFIIFD